MFNRQWFPYGSQHGLRSPYTEFENYLLNKDFNTCWNILIQFKDKDPDYVTRQAHRLNRIVNRNISLPIHVFSDGYWPGFNLEHSYLFKLLNHLACQKSVEIELVDNPSSADITFHSCFDHNYPLANSSSSTRLLFLGENVRPSFTNFDYSFSQDPFNYQYRNVYFPLWITYIQEFQSRYQCLNNFSDQISRLKKSYSKHHIDWKNRKNKIVFVGNNYEPLRTSILQQINNSNFSLEVYGSHIRPLESKYKEYGSAKYVLCPENSFYPGYVTEKLIDSVFSGAISIYWGGICEDIKCSLGNSLIEIDNDTETEFLNHTFVYSQKDIDERIHNFEAVLINKAESSIRFASNLFNKILNLYSSN